MECVNGFLELAHVVNEQAPFLRPSVHRGPSRFWRCTNFSGGATPSLEKPSDARDLEYLGVGHLRAQ